MDTVVQRFLGVNMTVLTLLSKLFSPVNQVEIYSGKYDSDDTLQQLHQWMGIKVDYKGKNLCGFFVQDKRDSIKN